jgi:hypothetical protein
MIIPEMILMGIFATVVMDLFTGYLIRRNYIHPAIEPEAVGRWVLYMFRGKFIHKNISETPELNKERTWSLISHYLIGIFLSGIYLLLAFRSTFFHNYIWMAFVFGVATVILPWFWLFPSMGFGFLALKSPDRSQIIRTSLVNHTNFGVGLLLWVVSFHRFFI